MSQGSGMQRVWPDQLEHVGQNGGILCLVVERLPAVTGRGQDDN